jgi:two-component system sensor histidine kinase TctE
LGLAIVREILTAHGGRITLSQRTPPPGLHAEIILPAG